MRPSKKLRQAIVLIGALLILGLAGLHFAPVREDARPDQLNLGTVYKGARVEASAWLLVSSNQTFLEQCFNAVLYRFQWRWRVLLNKFSPVRFRSPADAVDLSQIHPLISEPPFLHIEKITPRQNVIWFQGNPFVEVAFSLDTSTTGHFKGEITAALGRRRSSLPIEITVREAAPFPRALVVSPFYANATREGVKFNAAVEILSSLPCRCDYLRSLPESFDSYRLVLLAESPLANLSDSQLSGLEHLIDNGGRVIIACDSFVSGTLAAANRLGIQYGMQMVDEKIPASVSTNIVPDVLTANVNVVRLLPSPIRLTGPNVKSLVFSNNQSNSIVAVSRLPSGGELVIVNTAIWWNSLNQFPTNNDDRILFRNLLTPRSENR